MNFFWYVNRGSMSIDEILLSRLVVMSVAAVGRFCGFGGKGCVDLVGSGTRVMAADFFVARPRMLIRSTSNMFRV